MAWMLGWLNFLKGIYFVVRVNPNWATEFSDFGSNITDESTWFLRMEKMILFKKLAIALIAVLAATFLTLAIPSLSDGGMYFLFLTAIIFSTLLGNVSAGIFAATILVCRHGSTLIVSQIFAHRTTNHFLV